MDSVGQEELTEKTIKDLLHPQNRIFLQEICKELDGGIDHDCFVKLAAKAKQRGYYHIKHPEHLKDYFSSNGRIGFEFLKVLLSHCPTITVKSFTEVARSLGRNDICLELRGNNGYLRNIDNIELREIGRMLNKTPNNTIRSWQDFLYKFFDDSSDSLEKQINLTGKNVHDLSPTRKLFKSMKKQCPNTDLIFVIRDLELIRRQDVADYIAANVAKIKCIVDVQLPETNKLQEQFQYPNETNENEIQNNQPDFRQCIQECHSSSLMTNVTHVNLSTVQPEIVTIENIYTGHQEQNYGYMQPNNIVTEPICQQVMSDDHVSIDDLFIQDEYNEIPIIPNISETLGSIASDFIDNESFELGRECVDVEDEIAPINEGGKTSSELLEAQSTQEPLQNANLGVELSTNSDSGFRTLTDSVRDGNIEQDLLRDKCECNSEHDSVIDAGTKEWYNDFVEMPEPGTSNVTSISENPEHAKKPTILFDKNSQKDVAPTTNTSDMKKIAVDSSSLREKRTRLRNVGSASNEEKAVLKLSESRSKKSVCDDKVDISDEEKSLPVLPQELINHVHLSSTTDTWEQTDIGCYNNAQGSRDKHLGQCVLISNSSFQCSILKRLFSSRNSHIKYGTLHDQKVVETTFENLGFRTYIYKNQSINDIKVNLTKHSEDDHSGFRAFVCCLLSQGDNEYICDEMLNKLHIKEVMDIFNESTTLSGIPKLFIVRTIEKKNHPLEIDPNEEDNTYLLHSKNKDIDSGKGSTFIKRICEILEKCDKGGVHDMIKQLMKAEVL
ncbi:uncharacterized protein LOC130613195 [Hydractinia symbiolongicarpus]|uniref:uncharacterized protein LOC130613195 n=1 Tax=Hydractinia symbiolongicarpus TaxID=13093 RepID=UPI00254D6F8D|nr:uncharacterized protein LOC130613195 [Hydractinia symbiolongicarpus]XP_057290505.1 uncharacterized protein LOC130613195 [Hydractinia symbiolongicarpus]